jgi:hypothetical protein
MITKQSHEIRCLTDAEVDAVSGGKKRQQLVQTEQRKIDVMLVEIQDAQDRSAETGTAGQPH